MLVYDVLYAGAGNSIFDHFFNDAVHHFGIRSIALCLLINDGTDRQIELSFSCFGIGQFAGREADHIGTLQSARKAHEPCLHFLFQLHILGSCI